MAKKLEIKKTVIGKIVPRYKDKDHKLTNLYYGNIAYLEDGKLIHIDDSAYKATLGEFLDSPGGKLYDRPTDDEIEAATVACSPKLQMLKSQAPTKSQQDFKRGLKSVFGEDTELIPADSSNSKNKELVDEPTVTVSKIIIKETKGLNFLRFSCVALTLTVVVLVLGIFDIIPLIPKQEQFYKVITLKQDVAAGDIIKIEDLEMFEIPLSQFEAIADDTYITEKGDVKINYGTLWANAKSVEGKYAARSLSKGEFLKSSDYTSLKNGVNSVEFKMEDGSTVMLPISAAAEDSSKVRLYAIISSSNEDGIITNQAINLGELEFIGKSFESFINQDDADVEEAIEEVVEEEE